ncbi:hypothetical protein MYAER_1466 [Microcystis aeruginosa NIES-2549]|uniref:Uncharacterized protein n=1 Tax=Microcystis aeruginosa NIES-2549 TaxID=1641812 RepID=A0A0F6U2P7_MICAE|nr:hypothetical protein MYAER_1466 [Microcystis aeruginosa NIES-2549]
MGVGDFSYQLLKAIGKGIQERIWQFPSLKRRSVRHGFQLNKLGLRFGLCH